MSTQKRRKRAARQRRNRKIALIAMLVTLSLAILGLALWLSSGWTLQRTLRNYHMEYEDSVRAHAGEYSLPPAYVAAVILAESDYDPQAISSANAQGLMQILPDTAEWIAGKLDETYTDGCLFDPDTNMRYGCWYLSFLMRRFGGDMKLASSAYHAGQGTVDKWLQNPEYSPDGAKLAVIPYQSTDTYVQRILKYYDKYAELYQAA